VMLLSKKTVLGTSSFFTVFDSSCSGIIFG
jgi:hypothetical protein